MTTPKTIRKTTSTTLEIMDKGSETVPDLRCPDTGAFILHASIEKPRMAPAGFTTWIPTGIRIPDMEGLHLFINDYEGSMVMPLSVLQSGGEVKVDGPRQVFVDADGGGELYIPCTFQGHFSNTLSPLEPIGRLRIERTVTYSSDIDTVKPTKMAETA